MPVGAAIGVSGLAGAAANIFGGQTQANAATNAAKIQQDQYAQTRNDLADYRNAGSTATNQLVSQLPSLTAPIKMDQATLEQTPGYAFNLQQGLKSAQSSAAARGLGTSGAAFKGATTYATGLADSTYQQQYQNANTNNTNTYNRLVGVANLGEGAASQTGLIGNSLAQGAANSTTNSGQATAAGLTGAANSLVNSAGMWAGYNSPLIANLGATNMYASNANNLGIRDGWTG